MKKNNISFAFAGIALLPMLCSCNSSNVPANYGQLPAMIPAGNGVSRDVVVTPQAIPGVPRSNNHGNTGAYAPSNVQAQLKINVADGTKVVKVIRDNNDPFVITKSYSLKNADRLHTRRR